MNKKSETIIVYTDGASSGNPGPGGFGTIVFWNEAQKVVELGYRLERTTNNETELLALIEGFKEIGTLPKGAEVHIYVYLDSEYVRNGVTKWMYGWKKNNWTTSTGAAVKNLELWQELSEQVVALKFATIEYIHVDGHAGVVGNERVDTIAQGFSKHEDIQLYSGSVKKYEFTYEQLMVNTSEKTKSSSKTSSKKGGWYLSIVDGKLETHTTWTACETRVKGRAAKFKKVFTETEAQMWITKNL